MRRPTLLLLGSLGLAALMGCSGSDSSSGPTYGYLVNGIAVADLDGNGLPDILGLVSNSVDGSPTPGYLSTRLQTSAGAFALPTRFGVGATPANFVLADLNGDGRLDLVVANASDASVTVRLADPAHPGAFLPATVLSTPGRTPLDVAVGDLNGDGLPDVAVAASGANSVLVFDQTTGGAFAAPVAIAVGGDPQAVAVGDLDGNGLPDLAVATSSNAVSVLLQTSAGTFAPAVDYATGVNPSALKVVDLNGDGKLDLLTANYGATAGPNTLGLSVLLQGATAGTFQAATTYATDYRSAALAVGDLDGDGRLDVVVANAGLPGFPGSVSVLRQDPANPGNLLPASNLLGLWGPLGVAIADMDGDGHPDLVVADGDITVRYQSATTPLTFGPPQAFYN
ncbi:hypothetical protein GETHPA_20090 [Geothrix rubra]|uniref:VCBS repeat-containing protein n=1 Tax=Geothrix rubra TaxID=2927977 RepID=A0ABQ5Q7U1_9BACT|nr:VCBS repeat-containing protein [Geothrix rubra]GLH70476.1 hypothetical protein GETHPA_20090 [Geothrix rubra]